MITEIRTYNNDNNTARFTTLKLQHWAVLVIYQMVKKNKIDQLQSMELKEHFRRSLN